MVNKKIISLGLLVFVPISIAANFEVTQFFITSAIAIIPAVWLSTATEEVAVVTGPSIGALLNAVFGNATELIIALVALKVDIVKASITGTIISNFYLVMGFPCFWAVCATKNRSFSRLWRG